MQIRHITLADKIEAIHIVPSGDWGCDPAGGGKHIGKHCLPPSVARR